MNSLTPHPTYLMTLLSKTGTDETWLCPCGCKFFSKSKNKPVCPSSYEGVKAEEEKRFVKRLLTTTPHFQYHDSGYFYAPYIPR
jgi:hypothetical protein